MVVDEQPVSTIAHYLGLPQNPQLLRDVGLRLVEDRLQVADTRWVATQFVENLESGWV
jgi:hypothetical protein